MPADILAGIPAAVGSRLDTGDNPSAVAAAGIHVADILAADSPAEPPRAVEW